MRTTLILLALAAVLTGCAEETADQAAFNVFRSDVAVGVMRLRSQFSEIEPVSPERDHACDRLLFEMEALCDDDRQKQFLANELAVELARSETFKMYDRHVLSTGQHLLREFPPEDPSFLMVLAKKIENARSPDAPGIYRTTYSSLAVGIILNAVTYPDRVETYDDRINYAQWGRLHQWLTAHGKKLIYDPDIRKYRPKDHPPAPRPPREAPEA